MKQEQWELYVYSFKKPTVELRLTNGLSAVDNRLNHS